MSRTWVSALVIVVSTGAMPARQVQPSIAEPRFTDVYTSGDAGYHTFRIPAVIATGKGTLLAFAEARRAGAGDAGDIDLVVKRSVDGGTSWSALQVVGDNGPNTFGNPCPVLDHDDRRAVAPLHPQPRHRPREGHHRGHQPGVPNRVGDVERG